MKKDLTLADETFDEHFTNVYHLILEGGLKTFSYAMLDTRVNKCLFFRRYVIGDFSEEIALEKIEEILSRETLLDKPFKEAAFLYKGTTYALIPDEFFSKEEAKNLYAVQNTLGEYDELHTYPVRAFGATLCYAVPSRLCVLLKRKLPHLHILHESAVLLEGASHNLYEEEMVVLAEEDYLTCMIVHQKNIRFLNSFYFRAPGDVLYFLMGVCTSCQLDPASVRLAVMGSFDKNAEVIKMIKSYFPHLRFLKPSSDIEYSYKFRELESHEMTHLLNAFVCVS